MPIIRNQRTKPLSLRSATAYPLNQGIATAYDYADGDGAPHVGTLTLTHSGTPSIVSLDNGNILARDPSQGKTVATPYAGLSAGKLGLGAADGKGAWTIHRRYRTPSVYSGTSSNRVIATYRAGSNAGTLAIYMTEVESGPGCYFFVEPSTNNTVPPSLTRTSTPAFRVPFNTVVDLHIVRNVDVLKFFLNGVLIGTLDVSTILYYNSDWTGIATADGINGGTPSDLLLIDHTIWKDRALTDAEVTQHQSDPYAGYVNSGAAPDANPPQLSLSVADRTGSYDLSALGPLDWLIYPGNATLVRKNSTNFLTVTHVGTPFNDAGFTGAAASLVWTGGTPTASGSSTGGVFTSGSNAALASGYSVTAPADTNLRTLRVFAGSYACTMKVDVSLSDGSAPAQMNNSFVSDTSGGRHGYIEIQYAAGSVGQTITVTFTVEGGAAGRNVSFSGATLAGPAPSTGSTVSTVSVTPNTATIGGGTTQQFSASVAGTNSPSQAVTWSTTAGTVGSTGLFTAPASTGSVQTITVRATSKQDGTKSGTSVVTIPAVASTVSGVTVAPSSPTVNGGATQQFTATVAGTNSPSQSVNWTATGGTISATGLFTAPAPTLSVQTVTVTATSVQDNTKAGTTTVTVPVAQLATRTVSFALGTGNSVLAANLSEIMVAFYEEATPDKYATLRYQSASETTDASGVISFSCQTRLSAGAVGGIVIQTVDGKHFNGKATVA